MVLHEGNRASFKPHSILAGGGVIRIAIVKHDLEYIGGLFQTLFRRLQVKMTTTFDVAMLRKVVDAQCKKGNHLKMGY